MVSISENDRVYFAPSRFCLWPRPPQCAFESISSMHGASGFVAHLTEPVEVKSLENAPALLVLAAKGN